MGRAYSNDLRERVVRAVVKGGLSRHQAAAQFGVGISTAINWVQRFHETGSVAPSQIGGYRPKKIAGPHREWLLQRCRKDFTVRGLVAELAERGLKVDYRTMWGSSFTLRSSVTKKDADLPQSRIVPMSPVGERNGPGIEIGLIPLGWCSSMRPGPKPIWRRCGAGRRAVNASEPRCRMAAGRP
jgi:putative transposase